MRDELRRIAKDLRIAVEAERDLETAGHAVIPAAAKKMATAEDILARVVTEVKACRRCGLCDHRNLTVPGEGASGAPVMFIGEAPGFDEDRQGRPFVGKAGQLLEKMIRAIQIRREDVFIANILKCRPPNNRNPNPDEVASCRPWLDRQIAAVRPLIIVLLGRVPTHVLLETTRGITSLRGTTKEYAYDGGTAVALPTFHPSYLLRIESAKREAWEDMKLLHRLLREHYGDWPDPIPPPAGRAESQP